MIGIKFIKEKEATNFKESEEAHCIIDEYDESDTVCTGQLKMLLENALIDLIIESGGCPKKEADYALVAADYCDIEKVFSEFQLLHPDEVIGSAICGYKQGDIQYNIFCDDIVDNVFYFNSKSYSVETQLEGNMLFYKLHQS